MTSTEPDALDLVGLVLALAPGGASARWSSACRDLTGRTLDAVRGKHLCELSPQDEAEGVSAALAALEAGGRAPFDCTWTDATGAPRTIAFSGSRRPYCGLVLSGVDVTGLFPSRGELASLRDSEERFRALVEASAQVVWMGDASGAQTESSSTWRVYTGQSDEDARGFGWLQRIHPEDRDGVLDAWRQATAVGSVFRADVRVQSASGDWRWTLARAVPLRRADGSVRGWVGMNVDFTERKAAEDQLRFQSTVLDQVRDAVVAIDEAGRVTCWNRAAEERYGVSAADALRRPVEELYAWRWERPEDEREAEDALATTGRWRGELVHVTRDGREIPVETNAEVIRDTRGASGGLVAALRDVSARRRSERHAAFLAELDRAFVRLVAPDALVRHALEAVAEHLRVDLATFNEFANDAAVSLVVAEVAPQARPSTLGAYSGADFLSREAFASLRTGTGLAIDDVSTDPRTEARVESFRRMDVAALLCEPFVSGDGLRAAITVASRRPRAWAADEVRLLREVVARLHPAVERARAEQALRASEQRFRKVFEHAGTGIAIGDWEGRLQHCNPAMLALLGYEAHELLDANFAALVHPEDREENLAANVRLRRGDFPFYEIENRYVRKDGRIVWVHKVVSTLPDEAGKPAQLVALVTDITERRRAEEALRASEERLRLAMDASAAGAWSLDLRTGEASWDDRFHAMYGFAPDEPRSREAWLDRLCPADRDRAIARLERMRSTPADDELDIDVCVVVPGRGIAWMQGMGRAERDADGTLIKVTGVNLDITARKRLEREQRLLADLGAALASTPGYDETLTSTVQLLVRDLADLCVLYTVEDGGVLRRSRVAARDEGRRWFEETTRDLPIEHRPGHPVWEVLTTRRSARMDVTPDVLEAMAWTDDHRRALTALELRSILAVPMVTHGDATGVLLLLRAAPSPTYDEADLALAEVVAARVALFVDNARHYRAAQRAIRARDDVLGVVAHDLRGPLGTILMQASLLRAAGSDGGKPAGAIERSATRMQRLIQDLLDASRMEAGHLSLEKARVSPEALASESVEAQRGAASAASLEVRLEVAPGVSHVWADRDRLLQVLDNLVGNAVKFTPAGGSVTVGVTPGPSAVLFTVTDTGPGIADRDLARVFDRFWQARRGGRRGAGLGLPIAKGIVEAHGGRIWVESAEGKGTTFSFTIPNERASEPKAAEAGAR